MRMGREFIFSEFGKSIFARFLVAVFLLCILLSCSITRSAGKINGFVSEEKLQDDKKAEQADSPARSANVPKISRKIYFLNKKIAWTSCSRKKLCRTDNSGESWEVINDDEDWEKLTKLIFINEETGWAVLSEWYTKRRSYVVVKTIDGGKTWREVLEVDSPIYSISFVDEKNGIVSARWCPLYLTRDGGETWEEVGKEDKSGDINNTMEVSEGLHHVVLIDKEHAWGYGIGIWFSNDGGVSWENVVEIGEIETKVFGADFVNEQTGWIVGYHGQIWHMKDGRNWERVEVAESLIGMRKDDFMFSRVSFISSEEGWILGENANLGEHVTKLFYTRDGGRSWEVVYESKEGWIDDIVFLDSMRGFALREGELLRTMDGGRTWEVVQPIESKRKR